MSVLYKALQKAQAENEQKQGSVPPLDAERLAGSGALRAVGRGGLNWRTAGLAAVAVLVVAVGGGLFLFQEEDLPPPTARMQPLRTTPPPALQPPAASAQQQAATLAPGTSPAADAAAPAVQAVQVQPAPAQAPVIAPPPSQMADSQPAQSAVPAPTAEQQVAAAAPVPPAPVPAVAAVPATMSAPIPLTPSAPPATPAIAAPAKPGAAPASQTMPAQQAAQAIPADSPARVLNPPINISRADYDFAGVGDAVQVRRVSQSAQDNVGAGYNALVRGDYDMALGFYDRVLKQEPRSVMAELGRAAAFQRLGRLDEARAAYERVLKGDPNNREALSNLTSIMGEKNPVEALDRLVQLEREYPNFSPIKAQIGLLYAKSNSLDAALEYLRRAVNMAPETALYHYHLALVLDRLGRRDQAIAAYQRFMDTSGGRMPQGIQVAEIERRMQFLRSR